MRDCLGGLSARRPGDPLLASQVLAAADGIDGVAGAMIVGWGREGAAQTRRTALPARSARRAGDLAGPDRRRIAVHRRSQRPPDDHRGRKDGDRRWHLSPDSLQMTNTDPLQMTASDIEQLLNRLLPPFLWRQRRRHAGGAGQPDRRPVLGPPRQAGRAVRRRIVVIQTCVTGLEADRPGPGGHRSPGHRRHRAGAGRRPGLSQRAWVGRVVSFREHKGTFATLGRAAIAATGWPAFVTAGLGRDRARTPSVRHPRPPGPMGGHRQPCRRTIPARPSSSRSPAPPASAASSRPADVSPP